MGKLYPCEICDKEVPIRSKGLCPGCREKQRREAGEETMHTKVHRIPRMTRKAQTARKDKREGLGLYFETLILLLKKKPKCQNCGYKINPYYLPHNNIAHILPKSSHPSVMTNLDNCVFLCDSKDREDGKSCHNDFDNRGTKFRESMPVYSIALNKFKRFSHLVLEKSNIFSNFESKLEN